MLVLNWGNAYFAEGRYEDALRILLEGKEGSRHNGRAMPHGKAVTRSKEHQTALAGGSLAFKLWASTDHVGDGLRCERRTPGIEVAGVRQPFADLPQAELFPRQLFG